MIEEGADGRRAIVLFIDPATFERECGEPLTDAQLDEFGRQLNEVASHMAGYEGWEVV
jgi:hypothetical protein